MPALGSCPGRPAMVVAGARGKGVSSASAAGGVPGATNQRASASGLTADFGGTSSSITTGTSGAAGFALAATTGCGASTKVAGAVVSAVAAGPNELAMTERVAPIANNNANASHMTVCFIAASPEANRIKNPPYPPSPGRRWQLQNQFGLVRGRLMALAGRPRGKRLAVETKRRMGRAEAKPGYLARNDDGFRCALPILRSRVRLSAGPMINSAKHPSGLSPQLRNDDGVFAIAAILRS